MRTAEQRKTPTIIIRPIHPTVNSEPTKKKPSPPVKRDTAGILFFSFNFLSTAGKMKELFYFCFLFFAVGQPVPSNV